MNNWHFNQVWYTSTAYFYIVCLFFQSGTVTSRADGFPAEPRHHYAILYLVLIFFNHIEKSVNWHLFMYVFALVRWKSMPKLILLFPWKFIVRFKYRKIVFCSSSAKLVPPHSHFFTIPTYYATIVDADGWIWNDEFFVNADNASKALTVWASPNWGVKREHIVCWLFKRNAISFKFCGKIVTNHWWHEHDSTAAVSFIECCFCRVG